MGEGQDRSRGRGGVELSTHKLVANSECVD
jgi:hypothetical protein